MSVIYHYCDLNALLSIINNKKLWVSSAGNLNDYTEINYVRNIFVDSLNSKRNPSSDNVINEFITCFQGTFPHPYICSFSKNKDLLSQWRAYAGDGCGVSIGFNTEAFGFSDTAPILSMSNVHSIGINEVFYDDVEVICEFADRMSEAVTALSIHNESDRWLGYNQIASEVRTKCLFTKNKFFEEEQEVRIVHLPFVTGNDRGEFNVLHSISDLKQRVTGNKITSYFEYDFSSKDNLIFDVVLGPKCEINEYEIEMLLASNGYLNIPVSRSGASYR
ncbi:DUF2971 domain-containing protein [Proteus mirabilis]|uniref:DUF2971 domain-containing protein n=1 Tax=Morganellaceae TaxID=1903414 RepID=UPI0013EDA0BB|nr:MULTISPECIES: DUF2971 domain-containing protein [Morganellaceae]MBI6255409.1 DUF2971 domain-containing protein [Proteus mirabilis]MDM3554348.1 DUF2971 domain-containing protein [Proteus mirabilis]HCR4061250.1 DUF2971 domain-containing protein [Proteus mirabilis]HCT6318661.1 DUF2971 domain-containing protein [Proteus mirabilis]HCT6321889.1 DUF2971 domain-containing protein [Proteus mirabilis]